MGGIDAELLGASAAAKPAGETPPVPEILSAGIHVQDESGSPVARAVIALDGLMHNIPTPHTTSMAPDLMTTATTDGQGNAQVRYPKFIHEGKETGGIEFDVEHPDFAPLRAKSHWAAGEVKPVVLERIATVEITVLRGGSQVTDSVVMQDQGRHKAPPGGALTTDRLIKGVHLIRAVYLPPDSKPEFAKAVLLDVKKGQSYSADFSLQAGRSLRGRLDAAVPRPVENGRVIVNAVEGELDQTGPWYKEKPVLPWRTWAQVAPDGTFELHNLPGDQVELSALCPGYVSAHPLKKIRRGPLTLPLHVPQRFPLGGEDVNVIMEAAASLRVTVLDPAGKPLAGASVSVLPTLAWEYPVYDKLGTAYKTEDTLRAARDRERDKRSRESYRTTTDRYGQAVINDLPPWKQETVSVFHPEFELSPNKEAADKHRRRQSDPRVGLADFSPGEETSLTLTLVARERDERGRLRAPARLSGF